MILCLFCENEHCINFKTNKTVAACNGYTEKPKPKTAADRFRSMTDGELAAFIASNNDKTLCEIICGDRCGAKMKKGFPVQTACREAVLRQLKSAAEFKEPNADEWAAAIERMDKK